MPKSKPSSVAPSTPPSSGNEEESRKANRRKNPYALGTEATLAVLRKAGVLTKSGRLAKMFR